MANGNDETKQDTTQQANPDPLGVFGDNPPQPVKQQSSGTQPDPLGVFSSTDEQATPKEDTVLQDVHNQLEQLQKDRPPLKFAQPDDTDVPSNDLLEEANEELGLNSEIPFPQLPNSSFNTAQAVSTGVAPQMEGQRMVDISEAKKRVASLIEGYDEEPMEKRRRMVQQVQTQFNRVIEEEKEAGNEKSAAKLEGELENIKELERFLFERESAEYEKNTNFFTETKNQLKKGALSLMLSFNGRAVADNEMLDIYDQIDKTGEMPKGVGQPDSPSQFSGVGKWATAREYYEASPEEREQLKAARLEQLATDIADIKELRKGIQSIPTHPKAEKFLTASSFGESFDAFLNAPWEATTEVAFANLPQMTVTLGAGALGSIGGAPGAAAAAGSASKFMEYGNLILEELSREGVNIDDEEELMKAVRDEDLMKRVRKNANTGSSIVGLLDAAAFGLAATRFIPKGTVDDIAGFIGRETLDETIQITGQGFLGGSGAALSELARTGEVTNYGEIAAEAVGEGAFAPLRAFGVRRSIRMMKTARARHSVAEYITTDEILNKIKAERRKAVRDENEGRVAAADRLMASIKERRGKMVNEQRPRLAERRDELERKIANMEERHGSKAFQRDDFRMALEERDAINRMLEGEQILTEQTQQTDGTTQQTEQTQESDQQGTAREAQETQAQEEGAQEAGQESEQAQPESSEGQSGEQGADGGVGRDARLQERLDGVQRDIEQMESLDNPTETDNEYLMWLRDEQERLQARISNLQQQEQQQNREQSVGRYLEQAESEDAGQVYQNAWEKEGSYEKRDAGDYVARSGNFLFEIQRNEDGQWVARELNGEVDVSDTFGTRKEAKQAADQAAEAFQNADPQAKINSQKLKDQGMDEAAQQVVDESAGVEREHESVQIDENTYNYRGHLVRKAEEGNKWEIVKNGNVITSEGSFQSAMEGVNSIIDGQANTTTGQELGTPIKPENLNGAELPKGTLTTANKVGDQVFVGGLLDNHGIIADKHNNDPEVTERGFITPDGRYLNRSEAAEYTKQQKIETEQGGGPSDVLLSEQLTKQREKANGTNESKQYRQNTNVREQAAEDVKNKLKVDISNWGNSNSVVTKEQAEQIRQELYSGLGQLNMGIDPKALANAAKLATFHVEAGVRAFSDFAAVMIDEVGKQVVPHLRELYTQARSDLNIDSNEFSDKPEIDSWLLDYYKRDEETFDPQTAIRYVAETTNLVDEKIRSQLQHHALTELAKAYHNRSTDVNNILEFMDTVRERFPDQFSRGDMRSAWSAALSNAEERRRFWSAAKISDSTGIPLRYISFFSDAGILMRKKLQDSFIGQKRIQKEIMELRGQDYFNENERLDAYLQEELIRGRVSELQWEVTSMQNPNSTIRQILQVAKENNLKIGEWKEYYSTMQKARRARKAGNEENAVKLEKEALEMKPNEGDEVQQYLHAKHAEEANNFLVEQIEKKIEGYQLQLEQIPDTPENKAQRAAIKGQITRLRNQIPEAKRGAGMTNEEAQQVLDRFDREGKTEALQEIAEKVYEINETMLEMRRNNGLNSDQEIDEYQARFNNYVPLDRMMFDPYGNLLEQVGTSTKKGGVRGADFHKRTGSDRPVDNILGTVMMNYDQLIGDIERNNLVATLAELYDSEWAMGNEQYGRSVRAESAEDVDTANSIQYRKRNPDGSVEDRVLIFNSGAELVYDALEDMGTNHNSTTIKTVINGLRSFTNYLRFMRTSASMNFIFSNPQRDIGVVMGNMASDFGYGASLKFAKNIFHDKSRFVDAQRSIWEYMRGEDTPGAQQYRELKEMGGTTGFYQLSDRADILKRMRKVEKEIQDEMMREGQPVRNTKKKVKTAFRGLIRGIEGMNEIAENATRLTAYRMALENGYSKRRAASYALNINTNFNRSGDWGDLFKIGYQFANSAIQGHTRMARAAKVNPKTFMKTATALMTLGAANASFNDWMNEEAHERLRKSRPWLFNNNLVFLSPEGDVMFKIYLPFGYNVFKAAGDVVYDLAKGRVDADQAAVDMGNAVADSFNPFRGAQMFNGGVQGLMMAATPTVAEPFTEIALNKSFFGNIYPPFRHALQEQLDINDFQLKYDSVNPYMEYTTNFLAKHDVADISPETIEHMSYFLGGSVGREWINLLSESISTDKAQREGFTLYTRADGTDVKIMPNNIPVVSRFLNTVDEDRTAASAIYETVGQMSRKSMDVRSEEFQQVLDGLASDYEVLLENDATPEADREVMQKAMNAFVKTVFKNNMRDRTVEEFREADLTGEENEAARRRYYERINRQVRTFRIPQMERTDRANFRLLPYGTRRSKIFDENLIEQVEVKVNDITATAD